jgi:hypothetical protein
VLLWLLHVTGGDDGSGAWYLEWSGFVSLVISVVPLWLGLFIFLKKHNCHVNGCRSVITHDDPAVHAPACRLHHSHRASRGVVPPRSWRS